MLGNKKKISSLLALIMVFVMVFALAACSKKEDKKEDQGTTNQEDTNKGTEDETDQGSNDQGDQGDQATTGDDAADAVDKSGWITDAKYPKKDLMKREFVNGGSLPYTSESLPPDPETATADDFLKYENFKRIEEKYNCTFTALNTPFGDQESTFLASVMAGTPYADWVPLKNTPEKLSAVNNGLLLDLKSVRPADDDIFDEDKALVMVAVELGGIYPCFRELALNVQDIEYIMVNRNIIKTLNTPDPVDSYMAGEWTFDAFRAVCEAATKDTDGDNVIDQFGYACYPLHNLNNFILANGSYIYDADNKVCGYSEASALYVMQWYQDLFKDNLVYRVPTDSNSWLWDWEANYGAFSGGKIAMSSQFGWSQYVVMDSVDYNIVGYPKGPNNPDGLTLCNLEEPKLLSVIPYNVANPSDVVMIIEELMAWRNWDTRELVSETMRDASAGHVQYEEDVDRHIDLVLNRCGRDLYNMIGWDMGVFTTSLLVDFKTPAQVVEETSGIISDRILKVTDYDAWELAHEDDE